jgi:regulator of sigma E protease
MITLLTVIIFLAILIIGHEFGHFLTAKFFGLKVEEFGFGFPPRLFKKKIGDTTYTINVIPFGGFVKIYGEDGDVSTITESPNVDGLMEPGSFQSLSLWKKTIIIVAGAFMNFMIGWFAITGVFLIGTNSSVVVGHVANNSPATTSGLMPGDQIKDFPKIENFITFINNNKGKTINLQVIRGNKDVPVSVTPRLNPPSGEGPIGVSLIEGGIPKESFLNSFKDGFTTSVKLLGLIYRSIYSLFSRLFIGDLGVTSQFTGPVGIFSFIDAAGRLGFAHLLQILAIISLNLAALNIIPFPALDGGRLLFMVYEKISGGRLSKKVESTSHLVGFSILIVIMILVTIKDIINLV